jgi:hypothetical protein
LLDFKEGGKERKQTWSRSRDREKGSAVILLELTMGMDRKPSLVYQRSRRLKKGYLKFTYAMLEEREWTQYQSSNFKHSMGAKKRVGIGLSYRPTMLHRLAELLPWNRFLGSLKV